MPIYEYRCNECKKTFSRLQKIGAGSDGVKCPKCESKKVERLLSSFASTSSGDAPSSSPITLPPSFEFSVLSFQFPPTRDLGGGWEFLIPNS
jgi:putative FmdB family regulatory protein